MCSIKSFYGISFLFWTHYVIIMPIMWFANKGRATIMKLNCTSVGRKYSPGKCTAIRNISARFYRHTDMAIVCFVYWPPVFVLLFLMSFPFLFLILLPVGLQFNRDGIQFGFDYHGGLSYTPNQLLRSKPIYDFSVYVTVESWGYIFFNCS